MKYLLLIAFCMQTSLSFGATALQQAVIDSGIKNQDPLETKINKALILLNEKRYLQANASSNPNLPPPLKVPYELDSLRTPEQILAQKVGGFCGSTALAFAAHLNATGVYSSDIQIVASVVNRDLKAICPEAGKPRVANPGSASGHVFVAVRFPNDRWTIINSIGGSNTYERADWFNPAYIRETIKTKALAIPPKAYETLPRNTYESGLTVFQIWFVNEVPLHTWEQRFDLIASGKINNDNLPCRFTAP